MRGKTDLCRRIAMLLCAVLVLPSFITIFSCFGEVTKVSAAKDTSKGELPIEQPEKKPEPKPDPKPETKPKPQETVLLPDMKLPTMEVGVMISTPTYVRLKENRAYLPTEKYRVESTDESICVAKRVGGEGYPEYWTVKGIKEGTAKIRIYETETGKKIDTYRVNVVADWMYWDLDAGLEGVVQAFSVDDSEVVDSYILLEGDRLGLRSLIKNKKSEAEYELRPDDLNILEQEYSDQLKALEAGQTNVTVIEKIDGMENEIGTVTVTVEPLKLELLSDKVTVNYLQASSNGIGLETLVRANTDSWIEYSYTSANTDVVKESGKYSVKALKKGTADIVISAEINEEKWNIGTVTVTFADMELKTGTVKIKPEYISDDVYEPKVSVSLCVKNPVRSKTSKYLALQEDSKILYRDHFRIDVDNMPKNGTYMIFEKYEDLIVPVGNVEIKFVKPDASAVPDTPVVLGSRPVNETAKNPVIRKKSFTMGPNDISRHIASFITPFDFSGTVKYSYTIKDKKIVKIANNIITPLKTGKTTITVKIKVDGKTKEIGTIAVTVADKAATLAGKESYALLGQKELSLQSFIKYYHPKAEYTCKMSNKSVVYDAKKRVFTLKKAGTVKITITEKYKGKTKKLGTVTLTVEK